MRMGWSINSYKNKTTFQKTQQTYFLDNVLRDLIVASELLINIIRKGSLNLLE